MRPSSEYVVTVAPFDAEIGVFTDFDSFNDMLENLGESRDEYDTPMFSKVAGSGNIVAWHLIYIPKWAKVKHVWHESLHAAYHILDTYGVDVDVDNHEMLCYLQANIVDAIFEIRQIEKQKGKKK